MRQRRDTRTVPWLHSIARRFSRVQQPRDTKPCEFSPPSSPTRRVSLSSGDSGRRHGKRVKRLLSRVSFRSLFQGWRVLLFLPLFRSSLCYPVSSSFFFLSLYALRGNGRSFRFLSRAAVCHFVREQTPSTRGEVEEFLSFSLALASWRNG